MYIQAVEEANLITVNIGSNDILGNPLGQAMREMYNTDGTDKAILDAIKAELQKTGDFGTALLKLIGYAESIGQGTKLLVSLAYYMNIAYQQFTENWDAIVKNIYRLNPDVTLVAVGMHNAFANTSLTVGSVIKTGKLLQPIMDKMNAWMQTGSACAGQYIYCNVPDVECGELAFTQEDFWTAYLPAVHPTAAGHRYIADRILSVLPDTALPFEDVPEGAWYYMDVAASITVASWSACRIRALRSICRWTAPWSRLSCTASPENRLRRAQTCPSAMFRPMLTIRSPLPGPIMPVWSAAMPVRRWPGPWKTVFSTARTAIASTRRARRRAPSARHSCGGSSASILSLNTALSCACCIPHSRNCGAALEPKLRGGFSDVKRLKNRRI